MSCVEKRVGGDAWWWNEEVKEAVSRKREAHKAMCQNSTVENKMRLYMCFVDLDKAFDRVPWKVLEWALRKKGIPEGLVRSVMSLYEGGKDKG